MQGGGMYTAIGPFACSMAHGGGAVTRAKRYYSQDSEPGPRGWSESGGLRLIAFTSQQRRAITRRVCHLSGRRPSGPEQRPASAFSAEGVGIGVLQAGAR